MKPFTSLLFLTLCSWSVVDCTADAKGFSMIADFWCAVPLGEPQQVEYLVDWYFNKEYMMQYNSTVGKWTGWTPAGLIAASSFNRNQNDVLQRIAEKQLLCVRHLDLALKASQANLAEPNVTLVETSGSSQDTVLACSAFDFYPKYIRLTWRRDGQEVTSGVSSSEVLSNGDWTYQVHSFLEYTPGQQDGVSCVVEHVSLREPKIYDWESDDRSERGFLIGGGCALLLGAVFLSLGLIQYRRRLSNSL